MTDLKTLSTRELNLKAIGLRNRRDAFSHGSRHADEFVQELAKVEAELRRRREALREQPRAGGILGDGWSPGRVPAISD